MEMSVDSIEVKSLSEEYMQILNRIIETKDHIQAYQFLLYKVPNKSISNILFDIIFDSDDCRVMYETSLSIDGAPVERFYNKVKKLNSTYFIALFELDILK